MASTRSAPTAPPEKKQGAADDEGVKDVVVESVVRLGGMSGLAFRSIVSLFTGPFPLRDTVQQAIFMFKVTIIPVCVVNFCFGGGGVGAEGPDLLSQLGGLDRTGSFAAPGLLRELGIFLTGSVMAGVTGTMITAELGARKIRDELDALSVLSVDTIRYLVLPRIIALTIVGFVILMLGFVAGVFGVLVFVTILHGAPTGAFLPQLLSNTSFIDLYGAAGKTALFGLMIAVICCYKGLTVSGGAEGVGRAVNQAVVASLIGVFFLSLIYTYIFLGVFPDVAVNR